VPEARPAPPGPEAETMPGAELKRGPVRVVLLHQTDGDGIGRHKVGGQREGASESCGSALGNR
jgi:hypothetical protein